MSSSLTIFLPHATSHLEKLIEAHQERFEQQLKDLFDEDELLGFEPLLETIAAISVGPMLTELSFEDFYPDTLQEERQREFFARCRSCVCLEHVPFLESHAFQVTYLSELLHLFEEALIDRGGVSELIFKAAYLQELARYKSLDHFLGPKIPPIKEAKKFLPVDPIDFLVLDVYREIERLRGNHQLPAWQELPDEKPKKLFYLMGKEFLDPTSLYAKSGLNPKDFDDYLEKLKFWLKTR